MRLIVLTLLLLYWIISLDSLAIVPVVGQDEPWVAAVLVWQGMRRPRPVLRLVLAAMVLAVVVEGGGRIAHRHQVAAHTTPYDQFEAHVAALIPSGSQVLGLQHYWLGLRAYPYRTWLLPIALSGPGSTAQPMPFDQALEIAAPDVVLVDRYMRAFFDEASAAESPYREVATGFHAFMDRRQARLAGAVDDPTYGLMEVYWLN